MNGQTGYFLFSLDFELATGHFDQDRLRSKRFSKDGSRERKTVKRLVDLFEAYHIVGTWATVGHLFYEQCELCDICPMMEWKGKYSSFDEVFRTRNPLWYGSDLVDYLLVKGPHQEIGFHGYSHKPFDESLMKASEARFEVREWKRVAERKGVNARAVAFPRHAVGHLSMLFSEGMLCYRREPEKPALFRIKHLGRYFKALDQIIGITHMPVYDLVCKEDQGLIRLYSSQCFFELDRSVERFLDSVNLTMLRLRRVNRGIRAAAEQKKMVHLWAHPWDFQSEKDFKKLENIFAAVSEEVSAGRMRSVGMTEMANILIQRDKEQP